MCTDLKHIVAVFCAAVLLCSMSFIVQAAERLDVQVTPKHTALQKNIEAYHGQLTEGDATSLNALKRTVQQRTRLASEALGYYQTQIIVQVTDDAEPVLQVLVERGDPVRLRHVNIQVTGEAAQLPAFALPNDKRLKVGARLDHSAYDDVKSMLQNQALRFGFFAAQFTQHELLIDPQIGTADISICCLTVARAIACVLYSFLSMPKLISSFCNAYCRLLQARPITPRWWPS